MFLSQRALSIALTLFLFGVAAAVYGGLKQILPFRIAAVVLLVLAVTCFLCWKNQKIRVLSDEEFEYSIFLGRKKVYAFSDITGLVRNRDSMTLLMGGEKVHMESMAILSERLVERINRRLEEIHKEQ